MLYRWVLLPALLIGGIGLCLPERHRWIAGILVALLGVGLVIGLLVRLLLIANDLSDTRRWK